MLCLRCSQGLQAFSKSQTTPLSRTIVSSKRYLPFPILLHQSQTQLTISRTFTTLPSLRPSIHPSPSPLFRSSSLQNPIVASSLSNEQLAILPFKVSTHPALGSTQIRCAPRNTFSPSHFVRKRRHGFLSRLRTRTGRMTLKRRKAKKRSTLSH